MSRTRAVDIGLASDTTVREIEFVEIADFPQYTVGVFLVPKVRMICPYFQNYSFHRADAPLLVSYASHNVHVIGFNFGPTQGRKLPLHDHPGMTGLCTFTCMK